MKRIITVMLTLACLLCVTTAQAAITTTGYVLPTDPSLWNSTTTAYIANGTSDGTLTITEGDDVATGSLLVGVQPGLTGALTVSGTASDPSSSTFTLAGGANFIVGYYGTGSLDVQGNAVVTATTNGILFGRFAGSSSSLSVTDGATCTLNAALNLYLGGYGGCTVQVGNEGGTALSTLTFTGAHLDFGRNDYSPGCSIEIWENGVMDSSTIEGNIGYGIDATSSMVITGGTWNTADAVVGRRALGTLLIEKGGTVNSNTGILSEFVTSDSLTTITGEGSLWDCSGALSVGMDAAGALNILSGGELKVGSLCIDYDMVLPDEGTVGVADSNVRVGNCGMLTLSGQHDASMAAFLDAIAGSSERLMILDQSYTWVNAASATPGVDYTLTYDSVADATTLTAMASIPEPSTLILLLGVAFAGWFLRKK